MTRAEPPQSEGEHARRGRVKPLNVVHRYDHRLLQAEQLQHVANGDTDRALVDAVARCVPSEHRNLEGAAPGRGQCRQRLVDDAFEQITEAGVREAALGLDRPCRENPRTALLPLLDAREPQRRLADARLALEHERNRRLRHLLNERLD